MKLIDDERLIGFLGRQTCATICYTDGEGTPYCFQCFYAFDHEKGLLFFKTSSSARHTSMIAEHNRIAGSVLPDRINKLVTKGVQFTAIALPPGHPDCLHAPAFYHRKVPMALAMKGEVITLRLEAVKMTARELGIGSTVVWRRPGDSCFNSPLG
jgi:uncharacterized protein YhbP (UPF0306 family)